MSFLAKILKVRVNNLKTLFNQKDLFNLNIALKRLPSYWAKWKRVSTHMKEDELKEIFLAEALEAYEELN